MLPASAAIFGGFASWGDSVLDSERAAPAAAAAPPSKRTWGGKAAPAASLLDGLADNSRDGLNLLFKNVVTAKDEVRDREGLRSAGGAAPSAIGAAHARRSGWWWCSANCHFGYANERILHPPPSSQDAGDDFETIGAGASRKRRCVG